MKEQPIGVRPFFHKSWRRVSGIYVNTFEAGKLLRLPTPNIRSDFSIENYYKWIPTVHFVYTYFYDGQKIKSQLM